ncbi:MAG TPA: hypothetical protein VF503_06060 [Sphingobium sp.]|uniref:hypothetical protein n=1 Tax=Sphingobium sp. TaxID=1912891 RepID=UPI002ED3F02C
MKQLSLILAGVCLLAMPVVARAEEPASSDASAQNAELREALVSAQQELVRLRAQVAGQQETEAALKAARDRNERLIGIANELIHAYEKRYGRGRFLPFDNGRRRFEAELQEASGRVYDNRWDAGPRREPPAPVSAGAPFQTQHARSPAGAQP